jgi:hypothetical protein
MNKKRMEAAALVVGLSLFLWGCEKEVAERGAGRKVAVHFAVSNGGVWVGLFYIAKPRKEKKGGGDGCYSIG